MHYLYYLWGKKLRNYILNRKIKNKYSRYVFDSVCFDVYFSSFQIVPQFID